MHRKWKEEWLERYREEGGGFTPDESDLSLFIQVKLREDIYEAINENAATLDEIRRELSELNANFSDLIMHISKISETLQSNYNSEEIIIASALIKI